NEPPVAYYRFPIIGHTWEFVTNCKKLIAESRERYGDAFSLYVFGQLITVIGNEDEIHKTFKKDHDFEFKESTETRLVIKYVFPYAAVDVDKSLKRVRKFFKINLGLITSNVNQSIIDGIRIHVGECVEPKLVKSPNELFLAILRQVAANVVIGELFLKISFGPSTKIASQIRPIVEKRLHLKKKLGDTWDAPLDTLQLLLDDPEITPDFDPNHVNYDMIVDTLGLFAFAAMGTTSNMAAYTLVELAKRKKDYWQELYQEAQEINRQCNGNITNEDVNKMVKLDNFIKETFRINSNVLSLPRRCLSETYTFTNGFQVPRGRQVFLDICEIVFDEENQ
ncbi:798_t:CDS:2, partial [Racocetra persica]